MRGLHNALSLVIILIGLYLIFGFIGNIPPILSGVAFVIIGIYQFTKDKTC